MEIDDLWPSEDNSARIAELMLIVPPDSGKFKAVTMDGLVAGGLPDADYPLLPLERDSTDSTGTETDFAIFVDKRRSLDARRNPAKVFVRKHEVLILKNGEIFRVNGVR